MSLEQINSLRIMAKHIKNLFKKIGEKGGATA
jgi:hypothetical protein